MSRKVQISGFSALLVVFVYLAVCMTVGGMLVEYSIETWVSFAKGKGVDVPFWPCCLAAPFVSPLVVPVALLTWIIFLAM